jgi:hypothetical protein
MHGEKVKIFPGYSLKYILILSPHLLLGFASVLLPSGISTNSLHAPEE